MKSKMQKYSRKNKKSKKNVKHYSRKNKMSKIRGGAHNPSTFTRVSNKNIISAKDLHITSEFIKVDGEYLRISANNSKEICDILLNSKKTLTNFTIIDPKISEKDIYSFFLYLIDHKNLTELIISKYTKIFGEIIIKSISQLLHLNNTITYLCISDSNIGNEGIIFLSQLLKSSKTILTQLDISGNKINNVGALELTKVLKTIPTFTILDISNNDIGASGASGILKFAGELLINTKLTELNISNNNIGIEGTLALSGILILNKSFIKLTILDISDNKIGNEGAGSLSKVINVITTIIHLDISNNEIDVGAGLFAKALTTNTTLLSLNISNNKIEDIGALELVKALETNKTLIELDISGNNIEASIVKRLEDVIKINEDNIK